MTIYQLKEIINSKYNRKDTTRYERSVLFVVENTVTGDYALFSIDRISKHTASLRCNNGSRRELPGLVVIDWLYRIRLLENVRSSGILNMEIRPRLASSQWGTFMKHPSHTTLILTSPILICFFTLLDYFHSFCKDITVISKIIQSFLSEFAEN